MLNIDKYITTLNKAKVFTVSGRLSAVHDTVLEATGCNVQLGELMKITSADGNSTVLAEVVGLRDSKVLLMPFGPSSGLCLNSLVTPLEKTVTIPATKKMLGRIIDPLCKPLDDGPPLLSEQKISARLSPINPLDRQPIDEYFHSGIKAIDVFTTLGKGQRVGIMAGSGIGKSTLLGMIAARSSVDIVVIGLIGERGREVNDFIVDTLGPEGLQKSVVVVATADQPAVIRRQAAFTATAIANWFREKNKNVLLIMDSITRFAMAQREIGLSTGEPIGSRGYPASVFSLLPPLLEGGGRIRNKGSITSIFTVLVEGDDINDPIADHMRSLLDGHIVLSRALAARGHFPAIDISNSVSRLSYRLLSQQQGMYVNKLKKSISVYSSAQDMIEIGAYERGNNPELDRAINLKPEIDKFLTQEIQYTCSDSLCWEEVKKLAEKSELNAGGNKR